MVTGCNKLQSPFRQKGPTLRRGLLRKEAAEAQKHGSFKTNSDQITMTQSVVHQNLIMRTRGFAPITGNTGSRQLAIAILLDHKAIVTRRRIASIALLTRMRMQGNPDCRSAIIAARMQRNSNGRRTTAVVAM